MFQTKMLEFSNTPDDRFALNATIDFAWNLLTEWNHTAWRYYFNTSKFPVSNHITESTQQISCGRWTEL